MMIQFQELENYFKRSFTVRCIFLNRKYLQNPSQNR